MRTLAVTIILATSMSAWAADPGMTAAERATW